MRVLILSIVLAVTLPSTAQHALTLDECRRMALENNINLRNATNSVEAARQEQKEAFTKYFPTVSATGSAYNASKGLVEMDMPGLGRLSMLKNGVMGGVTMVQPVFAGGQIVNAGKLAKVGVKVSNLQREQTENDVRLTVERYYWQVVVLKEKLRTVQSVETMLAKVEKDADAAVKAGLRNRNDLLQVGLKQSDMEAARLDIENNLKVSRMLLAQYVGLKDGEVDALDAVTADSVEIFPAEIHREPQATLTMTAEYRLLESNVEASRLQQNLAVGRNLPTVAVGAGYMYDNLMKHSHSLGVAFVSVSVPISSWWGGSHDIRKRKLQLANAENSLADSSRLLQIRMQKAWNDFHNAWQQTLVAKKAIEQSAENLRLNLDYYKAGTTGMSDLLEAQTLYRQSQDRFVDAYAQYRIKRTEYLVATGR